MSSSGISFWSCAASCADQKEREVVGLYRDNTPLLISRPWCAPACPPVIQIASRRLYPLLASLISVADYYAHDGAWFGEVAADWKAIAAISGMSRNTIGSALQDLMREGFVHYDPAWGRVRPALVRVLPYNSKNGLRVFQIETSWLRAFVTSVQPKVALFSVETQGKSVEFERLSPAKKMSKLAARIGSAPIYIPKHAHYEPKSGAHAEPMSKSDEMLSKLEGVPGLEDVFNLASGGNPRFKINPLAAMTSPEVGLMVKDDWRAAAWSQGGVKVQVVDEQRAPAASDFGVQASWQIEGEVQGRKVVDQAQAEVTGFTTSPSLGLDRKTNDTQYSGQNDDSDVVVGTSPTAGLVPSAGAPSAPPAAALPAANAPLLLRSSQRQLKPGQVADLYRARGGRVSDAARRAMTTREVSCIETYERLAGVPFCEADLEFLTEALTLTSHECVLRGIRDSARFPDENPGYFVVRDGMKSVLNYISKSKVLNAKARGARTRTTQSGMDEGLQQKIRARRRKPVQQESKAPSVPPATQIVSPEAPVVSPDAGIVSQTTPAVSPEPSKGAA